ncbi:MAG TPA: RHS repeat-associated core domain-containing protein [Thermoanaerobaculia bacterium]|nr:RHS repeat-associated core domain-containing protein [Thermoanaerobaculia bacterium]
MRISTKVSPDPTPPSEKVYFHHADHLGSAQFITDERATVFQHLQYFPSGEIWVDERSESQRTPHLFSGKELDEETGLSYFGHRYYDARQGQWISADPILDELLDDIDSGDLSEDAFHLPGSTTGYVRNDPMNQADPDGLAKYKKTAPKAKKAAGVVKKVKSKRLMFVGGTPGKNSGTGKMVQLRMRSLKMMRRMQNRNEVKVFVANRNRWQWETLDANIHMGHLVDAVRLWNGIGRFFGPKHKVVRDIMKDPDNYVLEHGPTNMSKGATLGSTVHYDDPYKTAWGKTAAGTKARNDWVTEFRRARKQYLTPAEWTQLKKHVPAEAH